MIRQELIGLEIEVISSQNPAQIGLKGKIIDETQNTIVIQTKEGIKKLIKKQIKMKINNKEILGTEIVGRPEERIKK